MHEFLLEAIRRNNFTAHDGKELVLNHVFQAALDQGMSIESVMFDSGFVHDVGTPEDMIAAQRGQYGSKMQNATRALVGCRNLLPIKFRLLMLN